MRFPAHAIQAIRSTNIATSRSLCDDEGDDIVLVVPDGVQCEVRVEDGILIIEGISGDIQGPLIMGRSLNIRGGMGSVIEIKVPRSRSYISTENRHF